MRRWVGLLLLLLSVGCAKHYKPELEPQMDPLRLAQLAFGRPLTLDVPPGDQQTVITTCFAFSDAVWNEKGFNDTSATAYGQQIVTQWNTARLNVHVDGLPDILPMEVGGVLHTTFKENVPIYQRMDTTKTPPVPLSTGGGSALGWMVVASTPGDPIPAGMQVGGWYAMQAFYTATGCDLVHMVSHTDACGLGYECASGTYPFSSSDQSCTIGNLSGIHEMGHNVCAHHEPESECGQATCAGYNHGNGWPRDGTGIKERDPMTYPREGGNRVLYWSSPLIFRTINGIAYPTGDATVKDNARRLREVSPSVANFRVTVSPVVLVAPINH